MSVDEFGGCAGVDLNACDIEIMRGETAVFDGMVGAGKFEFG